MKAIILAGGKGRRLEPYTTVIPKPLMPIGDKSILEIILHQLREHGIRDVTIAVGHLAELIMAFCGDGSRFGLSITYSRLDKPLGTAGCLGLIKDDLPGLYGMFNESLPEEALKIATDLDMTGAQARWDAFAASPGAIAPDAVITGYTEAENAAAQQP